MKQTVTLVINEYFDKMDCVSNAFVAMPSLYEMQINCLILTSQDLAKMADVEYLRHRMETIDSFVGDYCTHNS